MTIKLKITLKSLLQREALTAAQLSRKLKVPPQTINNWLSGQAPRNLEQIKKVCDFFKVSSDYLLFGLTEEKQAQPLDDYLEEINAGTFEVVLRRVKK